MNSHPYYVVPDIEALATEKNPEALRQHRRRIAVIIGDPDAAAALLGETSEDFHDFYGTSELPELSTEDTIDSFLEKFGKKPQGMPATADPLAAIAMPAIDYATLLEKEEQEEGARRIRPKKEEKEVEKPSLTESFAKIMIKNGNYQRALEIITEISLNNPEKSIYFADQIRFLKKVILIQEH